MNQILQQILIWLHKWGWLAAILATLTILLLVPLYVTVSRFDHVDPDGQHRQAAIILGAALWDGKPSPALTERLNMGLHLYKEHKVDHLILSGGLEKWNGISEAEAMKRYLTTHGKISCLRPPS
jgi:vancomycin permeability regulator SanA